MIQVRSFMVMFFALIIMLRGRKPSSSVTFTCTFTVSESNPNPLVESLSPNLAVKVQTEVEILHPFLGCGLAPIFLGLQQPSPPRLSPSHSVPAPKGGQAKGSPLEGVYGDLTPKEKCTCRVRARGCGWRDAACAEVASRAGATVDGHFSSYNFEQWVNGDGG